MQKRFSVPAFIIGTLIHFAGTWALFTQYFRSLDQWRQTGILHQPIWLAGLWWIWVPIPLIIRHAETRSASLLTHNYYSGPSLLVWSLCVGAFFGFLMPRFIAWRRRSI
jgi:hypothetical protein